MGIEHIPTKRAGQAGCQVAIWGGGGNGKIASF